MLPLVLLWTDQANVYWKAIENAGLGDRLEIQSVRREETPNAQQLERTELMLAWHAAPGLIERMPRLRWIQTLSVGVGAWLKRPDLHAGIALTCARGVHRVQMPENILGALFHLTKHYAEYTISQRDRHWAKRNSEPLAGKTLGILGLGTIGQELARKAAALELHVIGTKRSPQPLAHVDRVYPPQATDEVLGQSDYLVLLLPDTRETDGFMNALRFRAMRSTAYLLNFGRGALVIDEDLVEAVRSKTIAGAVLDVFRREPLPPDHPFWTTEGITVLPHIGGSHPQRDRIVAGLFVENLRRYLSGEPLLQLVDRTKGY